MSDEPTTLQSEKCSIKFVRNSKGDTQVELRVVEGADPYEVGRIRELALAEYTKAVEATGGLVGAV